MMTFLSRVPVKQINAFFTNYLIYIVNTAIVFLLTLTMVYFPVTAFTLQIMDWVIVLSCALFSAVFVCLAGLKRWRLYYLGCVICIGASAFFSRKVLVADINKIVRVIESVLLYWEDASSVKSWPDARGVTVPAIFCAALCALLFSYVLAKRKSLLLLLIAVVPIGVLSYSISAPDAEWNFVLVVCLAILILADRVRRSSALNGARLCALLLIPVTVFFSAICAVFPESGYDPAKPPYTLRDDLQELGSQVFDTFAGKYSSGVNEFVRPGYNGMDQSGVGEWQDLNQLGALQLSSQLVMSVYTNRDGGLYLRGRAHSIYEDGVWSSYTHSDITDLHFMMNDSDDSLSDFITIDTLQPHDVLYTPYYAAGISARASICGDAYLENMDNSISYSVEFSSDQMAFEDIKYKEFVYDNCLYLEPDTAITLLSAAQSVGIDSLETSQIPEAVKEYVSNAAVYDLSPTFPPEDSDPIIWFLTEGKRGYCVHFASACAAMLRSLGIPARMVTGYYVTAKEGWNDVRGYNAHAWTEYYDPSRGWIPIDATGYHDQSMYHEDGQREQNVTSQTTTTTASSSTTQAVQQTTGTAPSDGAPVGGEEPVDQEEDSSCANSGALLPLFYVALVFASLIGLAVCLNRAARRIRKHRMTVGAAADRAEFCWSYILRLCRAGKIQPDEDMRDIVLKAQFSRFSAAEDELMVLYEYAGELSKEISSSTGAFLRIVHMYIIFLY